MSSRLPRFARLCASLAAGAAGIVVAGCATTTAADPITPTTSAIAAEAEQTYLDGTEQLASGALLEAEQEFFKLLKLPSYIHLTALARLRLGDAQFHQHKYDEAIETYLSFAQRHDGSENVPYAMFMVAKSHMELAPSDLWFMPPVYELDLSAVQSARVHIERFLRQFPRSRFVTEAVQLRERCLDVQWAHQRYVIEFYRDRKQWIGMVFRLHHAMQQFPTRAQTPALFAELAQAYTNLDWRARALDLWTAIARRWPDSPEAGMAAERMAQLNADIAAAKAKGDPAAAMPVEPPPAAVVKPELLLDGEWEGG